MLVTAYTTDLLRAQRVFPSSGGGSPLYDGIYLGLELIKEAANPRRILIVVTGGEDSGTGISDLKIIAFAMKQPVQIYPLHTIAAGHEHEVLRELSDVTGGRDYIIEGDENMVASAVREIARGIRTQYLIGYKPLHRDGRRHGIKVNVDRPEGSPKLTVWTKSGYVADKG